jgi:effector-binding domain-containing protein
MTRTALVVGVVAVAICAAAAVVIRPILAPHSPPPAPAPPQKVELQPEPTPPAKVEPGPEHPAALPSPNPPEGLNTRPGDPFGVETALAAKPILYVKGSAKWDQAFATISGSLKKVEAYMAKEGLKADGMPMTIFTATDDVGFDYEAGVPLGAPPKNPPHGEIVSGQTPAGRALEFVHRGSYEAMDDTYEAITNYMDEKRLESRNILVEQYVTDPASADGKNLVVNVLVLIK